MPAYKLSPKYLRERASEKGKGEEKRGEKREKGQIKAQ